MFVDFRHQDTGAAFLAARRFAYLADEPGLGKSRQTVLAADQSVARKILVICPGAVRRHWEAEFRQWSAIDRLIIVEEGRLSAAPKEGVTIVSHAALSDTAAKSERIGSLTWIVAGAPYDLIVLDEAHEFRQYGATRTFALLGPDGLASRSKQIWLLSGTPVVNSAADLFPLMVGALGLSVSWLDFCNHYTEMKPDPNVGQKPTGIKHVEELAEGLRPYFLRRTIASLDIDMPPLTIDRHTLAVPQADISQIMAQLDGWTPDQLRQALEDQDELRDSAMARVRKALGLAKAPYVAEWVNWRLTIDDSPVVVFFQHTDVRIALFNALRANGRTVSWIDGKVTATQLDAAKKWFQAGKLDALLVQTQAGGQGLTLTRGRTAAVAELPWTATALEQAIKRIHRIGQKLPCYADILSAPNCWLDEVLSTVVAAKRRHSDKLLSLLTTNA